MSKKFQIITLGCKVNQYETASIQEKLISKKWQPTEVLADADIAIINTCIVTRKASYQSRQAIRRVIRENPSATVAVVGCYSQVFPDELGKIKGIDIIAGNSDKAKLPSILDKQIDSCNKCTAPSKFKRDTAFEKMPVKSFLDRTRAFLKIQDGCDSFCSYCIVPYARGPLRSLEPSAVIDALKTYSGEGYKEIVLTGIHLGKYGKDLSGKSGLKDLLREIGKKRPEFRIRLSSLEPGEIDSELIEMMASEKWICRHFHIPLQSGDKRILKRMNRNYDPDDFRSIIMEINKKIPQAAIGVDVIAGFPGEDEGAFDNSYNIIKDLPVSYLHVFPFSAREGTAAADFPDQIAPGDIKERAGMLRTLGKEKKKIFYQKCAGHTYRVLAEGWDSEEKGVLKGFSDNYLTVLFKSDVLLKNRMVNVKAERAVKDRIIGKVEGFL